MADKKKSEMETDANPDEDVIGTDAPSTDVVDPPKDDADVDIYADVADNDGLQDPEFEPETPEPEEIAEFSETELLVPEENQTDDIQPDVPEQGIERIIEKRGGFGPALVGGVLAAGLGFFAARSDILDPILPAAFQSSDNAETIAALKSGLGENSDKISVLAQDVSAIVVPDQSPLVAQLESHSAELNTLSGLLAALKTESQKTSETVLALDARLTDLEKRPISDGVSDSAIKAYERELAAMQESMATQRAEVEALISNAQALEAEARALEAQAAASAQDAINQTTVTRLLAALNTGSPYAELIAQLSAAGVDVPAVLSSSASDGIATLSALQASFPDVARDALAVARSDAATKERGIGAFLQRQLGARSVEPKDGNDPDAILSRAEAALTKGDLSGALAEVSQLPDASQAVLADWTSRAGTRMSVVQAAEALALSLKTN